MTTKADFNAEEWATVVEGPLLAGMKVVASERGGTLRESLAVAKTYAEARKHHGTSPLLDEIVASPPTLDAARLREGGEDLGKVTLDRLREAVGVAEGKATEDEVDHYKKFVATVAEAVANANREGGFIGIGGNPSAPVNRPLSTRSERLLGSPARPGSRLGRSRALGVRTAPNGAAPVAGLDFLRRAPGSARR